MDGTINAVDNLLHSKQKLERDRGIIHLKQYLRFTPKTTDIEQEKLEHQKSVEELLGRFVTALSDAETSSEWEFLQGCLSGATCVIDNSPHDISDEVKKRLESCALKLLIHDEVRVRLASGELLGSLCRSRGVETYEACSKVVLGLVKENLERQLDAGLEPENTEGEGGTSRSRTSSVDAATIYHESAGWRHLETSMKCLQFMIEGCGKKFNPYVTQELLDLIFKALSHENRFVRETGYYVCASLVNIGQPDEASSGPGANSILKYGDQFSTYLAKGLADNWSQVRLASSTATRHFLLSIPSKDARKKFYSSLLPRICLNRYYVADGVRIYTQETWKKLSEGKGRDMVEAYIDDVVEYYVTSTKADNHAVREAACACIAELGSKIRPDVLRPHISTLLKSLLDSFQDDSWPVRDAACVACGNFIVNFADEAADNKDELYRLFLVNLRDPISSVRQGAAGAVANYVKAYGKEALETVLKEIEDGLKEIEKQPANTIKYSGLDKSPAQFGVVKKLRDNDIDLHTNQTMYSCGSLAPKMGRGRDKDSAGGKTSSQGGCSDCRFQRPSEPWERSDGCMYLITEILAPDVESAVGQDLYSRVCDLLPLVVEATSYRQFTQHVVFIETVCRQLPAIGRRLGKRLFKPQLEKFFDAIFYALECDTQLTSSASEDCLNDLANFLGPSILRGRIDAFNPRYLEAYEMATRKIRVSDPGVGPSPGSLTPFPKEGFVPFPPTSTKAAPAFQSVAE